jgi:competence ComEA-like helix-hairpin-helix protein
MVCPNCQNRLPDGGKFCNVCGTTAVPEPQPALQAQPEQHAIPDGFLHDPDSGLYYRLTPGQNLTTGENGQWATWFYPDTGDYQQQFHADQPAPAPVAAVRHAQTAKPMQPKQPKQKPASYKKGRLKPLAIVLPVIALIVGAGIYFTQFGGQGNAVLDGVVLVNPANASAPVLRSYGAYIAGERRQGGGQPQAPEPVVIRPMRDETYLSAFVIVFMENVGDISLDDITDIIVYVDGVPNAVNAVSYVNTGSNWITGYAESYMVVYDTHFTTSPATYNIICKYKGMELKSPVVIWDTDGSMRTVQSIEDARNRVDINTASSGELANVPGIGSALAERIVEYRNANGPFADPNDLINVSGIGDRLLESILPYIMADAVQTGIAPQVSEEPGQFIKINAGLLDMIGKTNGDLRRINGDNCKSYLMNGDLSIADYHDMPVEYPVAFWLVGEWDEVIEIWGRHWNGEIPERNIWGDSFVINNIEAGHDGLAYVFHADIPLTYDNMSASFDQESELSHIPEKEQEHWSYGFDIWSCDFSYYSSGLYRFTATFNEVNGEITLHSVIIGKS